MITFNAHYVKEIKTTEYARGDTKWLEIILKDRDGETIAVVSAFGVDGKHPDLVD